jgi:hypothetical protein
MQAKSKLFKIIVVALVVVSLFIVGAALSQQRPHMKETNSGDSAQVRTSVPALSDAASELKARNAEYRKLGSEGTQEALALLEKKLTDNIAHNTGFQTDTEIVENRQPSPISNEWLAIPSENRTIIEILAEHKVRAALPLAREAVKIISEGMKGSDGQEAESIAYVINQNFGEQIVVPN